MNFSLPHDNFFNNNVDFLYPNRPDYIIKPEIENKHYITSTSNNEITMSIFCKEEDHKITPKRGLIEEEVPFNYVLNKMGFRSKNFEKFNNENHNILFSGCSFTFGQGLPEDLIWTKMLEKKISNFIDNKKINSYNLGIPGSSIQLIIKNIFSFINVYGKPDEIFVLLPEASRAFNYDYNNNTYRNFIYRKEFLFENKNHPIKKYMESFVYENNLFYSTQLIQALEIFCNNLNINLIWSTWINPEGSLFEKLNFKNFVYLPKQMSEYMNHPEEQIIKLRENEFNLPYWQHARDLQHPGSCFSTEVSDIFYKRWLLNAKKN